MQLNKSTFAKLQEVTSDITIAIETFDAACDEFSDAEDSEDRDQARTDAMEAVDQVIRLADNSLRHLREQIEY